MKRHDASYSPYLPLFYILKGVEVGGFSSITQLFSHNSEFKTSASHCYANQFEAIHPFHDGNGRTARILNILYLIEQELLTLPILYLSRYIVQHKPDYYALLNGVTKDGNWQAWIIYMLRGVTQMAQ